MRYFKAIEIENLPFIQWALWANDENELKKFEPSERNLILAENDIPEFQLGVCPLQIINGKLVNRSKKEVQKYEKVFLSNQNIKTIESLRSELKNMFYAIQFTNEILEDSTDLQALYDAKLQEYNTLKTNNE